MSQSDAHLIVKEILWGVIIFLLSINQELTLFWLIWKPKY